MQQIILMSYTGKNTNKPSFIEIWNVIFCDIFWQTLELPSGAVSWYDVCKFKVDMISIWMSYWVLWCDENVSSLLF